MARKVKVIPARKSKSSKAKKAPARPKLGTIPAMKLGAPEWGDVADIRITPLENGNYRVVCVVQTCDEDGRPRCVGRAPGVDRMANGQPGPGDRGQPVGFEIPDLPEELRAAILEKIPDALRERLKALYGLRA